MYGFVLQIQNYIIEKYNDRKTWKSNNPSDESIGLDSGNFSLDSFEIHVFDRRFRHRQPNLDCVRIDTVGAKTFDLGNLNSNLDWLKEWIYQTYILDIVTFIPMTSDSTNAKILDKLNSGNYPIPTGYSLAGNLLASKSIYYLNIAGLDPPTFPVLESIQIYNLIMIVDLTGLKVSFANYFTKTISTTSSAQNFSFYYYWVPPPPPPDMSGAQTAQTQTWNYYTDSDTKQTLNSFDSLFSNKKFLYDQKFISENQLKDPSFNYSSEKDIAEFEIDFSTYVLINPITNGLVDIKKMNYPPVGYYLGFRPDLTKTIDQFTFGGVVENTERSIRATKSFSTTGEDYMFLRINDWGYLDFFSKKMFAKILLTTGLGNPKIDDYVNKEYRFRQPVDINKIDIELVDYLGNTVSLGGYDWSFTLELKQIVNSCEKTTVERNALVFNSVYKS
jgi:hypothetical protein